MNKSVVRSSEAEMASCATSVLLLLLSALFSAEAVPPDKPNTVSESETVKITFLCSLTSKLTCDCVSQGASPVDVAVNLNVTDIKNEVEEVSTTTAKIVTEVPALTTTTVKPAENGE